MKVLITGANGMVAKAVSKHCRKIGDSVSTFTKEELDIVDKDGVLATLKKINPDAVINCAAFTDVDESEEARDLAYSVNARGVENLAFASKEIDCRFLTISTDYVFDGTKKGLYDQRDTPNPISFYGESKLAGEILARNTYARSIIVRTGWIFGNYGTNFLSTMHQYLERGKKIKVIGDSYGTPTFTNDLAVRLRSMVELDLPLIYHVGGSGSEASFYDFALEICEQQGFDVDLVEKCTSESLQRPAKRPMRSGLRCLYRERVGIEYLPNWKDSLKAFLSQKETQISEASNI